MHPSFNQALEPKHINPPNHRHTPLSTASPTLQHNDAIETRSPIDSRDAGLLIHEGLISWDGRSKNQDLGLAKRTVLHLPRACYETLLVI